MGIDVAIVGEGKQGHSFGGGRGGGRCPLSAGTKGAWLGSHIEGMEWMWRWCWVVVISEFVLESESNIRQEWRFVAVQMFPGCGRILPKRGLWEVARNFSPKTTKSPRMPSSPCRGASHRAPLSLTGNFSINGWPAGGFRMPCGTSRIIRPRSCGSSRTSPFDHKLNFDFLIFWFRSRISERVSEFVGGCSGERWRRTGPPSSSWPVRILCPLAARISGR